MKSWYALVQREYLEHRGAFVYAPALLSLALLVAVLLAFFSSRSQLMTSGIMPVPGQIYAGFYLAGAGAWTAFLLVGLFFYFADAFSADRKGNALLFWKSMPQTDLKLLVAKLLAGATIFPLLIVGWLIVTSIIAYFANVLLAVRVPELMAPNLLNLISSWTQITLAAVVFMALSILWYAPVYGWVGGLSAVFRGWSIPLAIVVPVVSIILEMVLTYSGGEPKSAIRDFLMWRLQGFYGDEQVVPMLLAGQVSASRMIGEMVGRIDWLALVGGLVFTAVATWAASEYRRRRIES